MNMKVRLFFFQRVEIEKIQKLQFPQIISEILIDVMHENKM
jgi:hypothetical protein